ncbi:MAG: GNAT family N-acetyltransferase [Planctomycetota bacterium]
MPGGESAFAAYRPDGSSGRAKPVEGLAVRPAAPRDLRAVAEIRSERDGGPVDKWAGWAERVREGVERAPDRSAFLVAEGACRVVGYGYATFWEPPDDAPANSMPAGWYLLGVCVSRAWRRRGVGARLTAARLAWIAERAETALYFANENNGATLDLHAAFGFREVRRGLWFPGVSFSGGAEGVLFRAELGRPRARS